MKRTSIMCDDDCEATRKKAAERLREMRANQRTRRDRKECMELYLASSQYENMVQLERDEIEKATPKPPKRPKLPMLYIPELASYPFYYDSHWQGDPSPPCPSRC